MNAQICFGKASVRVLVIGGLVCLMASPAFAVGVNPFHAPLAAVKDFFINEVALYGSLIAMVIGGLTMASGQGHHSGIGSKVFGVGFAMLSAQLISWLFT